jgi:hypothetical protein
MPLSGPVLQQGGERHLFEQIDASERSDSMVERTFGVVALGLLVGLSVLADDKADREKLIGSWQPQVASSGASGAGWTFVSKGNSLEVTELDGEKKIARFECSTDGTGCEIKTGGKKATISMWFNGPKLVQMETRGSDVVKRRFGILPPGDAMEMEVIPIVPSGPAETLRFKRVQPSDPGK